MHNLSLHDTIIIQLLLQLGSHGVVSTIRRPAINLDENISGHVLPKRANEKKTFAERSLIPPLLESVASP